MVVVSLLLSIIVTIDNQYRECWDKRCLRMGKVIKKEKKEQKSNLTPFPFLLWPLPCTMIKYLIDWTIRFHKRDSFAAGSHLAPREWGYKQLVMTTGKCKERAPFGFAGISHIHGHLGLEAAQQSPEQNDKWGHWVCVHRRESWPLAMVH